MSGMSMNLQFAARACRASLAVTVLFVATAQLSFGGQVTSHKHEEAMKPADAQHGHGKAMKPAGKQHDHGKAMEPADARHDLSIYQLDSLWRDDHDAVFPLASLQGQPVVLSMIYTSCQYVCPVLVQDVKRIEAALPPADRQRVSFVLVSFDPARDTPQALAAYRVKRELTADRWMLLTGQDEDVLALAAVLGVRFRPDGKGDFAHSNLITVLDAEGVVRHQQVGANQDGSASAAVVRELLKE